MSITVPSESSGASVTSGVHSAMSDAQYNQYLTGKYNAENKVIAANRLAKRAQIKAHRQAQYDRGEIK